MFTSRKDAVRMLLEEAAKWHTEAARAPEKAAQMLAGYRERYRTDAEFRAETSMKARAKREQKPNVGNGRQYGRSAKTTRGTN